MLALVNSGVPKMPLSVITMPAVNWSRNFSQEDLGLVYRMPGRY